MHNTISTYSSKILTYGSFLITVIVLTSGLNEPVNAPKMLILVVVAFALLPLCFLYFVDKQFVWRQNTDNFMLLIILFFFIVWIIISNLLSSEPFEHGFYGTYGRNTGTLTYFALCILFVSAFISSSKNRSAAVLNAFLSAGIFNVVYFILTKFGIEIFDWNNPSKAVLGTFGNSNFAGAFMGLFFVFLIGSQFIAKQSKTTRGLTAILIPITFYEVIQTRATQGVLVCGLGSVIICFYFFRYRVSKILLAIYTLFTSLVSVLVIAGIFQIGPLQQYLYKTSVSLRGGYWAAGWEMGANNPLFGVGPDSYGFYYRTFRGQKVLDIAGPSVATDAAHNVFMDIFAYGGIPLLLAYVGIQVFVVYKIFVQFKTVQFFDPVFVTIVACWVGYQAQSIVSINQIGVAIWGWILGGLIVGYQSINENHEISIKVEKSVKKYKPIKDVPQLTSSKSLLLLVAFTITGILIAMQPILSDAKYFSALQKREISAIDNAARRWPTNPIRLGDATTIFAQNGFNTQAIKIARYAVEKYPHSYLSWYVFYNTQGITQAEKEKALKQLQKIDPLNVEFR